MFYSANGIDGWSQVCNLFASDGAASDQFGKSVAIYSNIIVVGAWYDDTIKGNDAGICLFIIKIK